MRALQRSIIVAQIYGAESGLKEIFSIKDREKLEKYHLYFATLGEFYAQLHRFDESINYLKKSIELTSSLVEKNYLYDKIRQNKGRMR